MAKTLFEVMTDKLDEEIDVVTGWLSDGKAKSYEHYREMVGTVNGLHVARTMVTDLEQRHREDDDE